MDITGRLKVVGDTQAFGANNFLKREIVVQTEGQYPQDILIELVQNKTSLVDTLELGDLVKVHINIRGREWTNPQGEVKYFNSIQGWKIERLQQYNQPPQQHARGEPKPQTGGYSETGDSDDLPF